MNASERTLAWFLRLTSVVLLASAMGIVLPYAWMETIQDFCGLGVLPDAPLVSYLARSLSALYAVLGAGCWFLAEDVRRYRPLLGFSVSLALLYGGILFTINVIVAMPIWWTAAEAIFLPCWAFALWWLLRRTA